MSLSKIKPKLNPEILYGILQEFGNGKEESSRELIKFMLAGREPCRAFLDYFSKATRVNFRVHILEIVVMNKIYRFRYDWEFLNIFLKVAIPSINHLSIFDCPGSERGFEILDRFLKPGMFFHYVFKITQSFFLDLKCLTLFDSLPSRYMDFFKQNCNFESVHSQHFHLGNASVLDVFAVPSEEHYLEFISYMNFVGAIPYFLAEHLIAEAGVDHNKIEVAPTETYPAVKKLVLDFYNNGNGTGTTTLSLVFPNLQSYNAKFPSEGPWQNFIENLLSFSPLSTPSILQANLHFIHYDADGRYEEVLHLKETNPEIIFNESDATISKSYEYRDGGFAHFVIKFGGTGSLTDDNVVADNQNNVIHNVQDYVANVAFSILNMILTSWFALPDTVHHVVSCFFNACNRVMSFWIGNRIVAYFLGVASYDSIYFMSMFIATFVYELLR